MKQEIYVFLGPNLDPLEYDLDDVIDITNGTTSEIKIRFRQGSPYDRTHPTNYLLCHSVEFKRP